VMAHDLQLVAPATPTVVAPAKTSSVSSPAARTDMGAAPTFEDARQMLADRLATEIETAISSGAKFGPPLGKWLARDLVLEAFEQAGQVAAKGAACLQLPETTFSRRLRQAEAEAASTRTSESWTSSRSAIADLVRSSGRPPGNLVEQADDLLFQLVMTQLPDSIGLAASLMGVSVPTLKRRLSGVPL